MVEVLSVLWLGKSNPLTEASLHSISTKSGPDEGSQTIRYPVDNGETWRVAIQLMMFI